jgi:hypothetical protein
MKMSARHSKTSANLNTDIDLDSPKKRNTSTSNEPRQIPRSPEKIFANKRVKKEKNCNVNYLDLIKLEN